MEYFLHVVKFGRFVPLTKRRTIGIFVISNSAKFGRSDRSKSELPLRFSIPIEVTRYAFIERSVTLNDSYIKDLKCETPKKWHFIHARFACHENPK